MSHLVINLTVARTRRDCAIFDEAGGIHAAAEIGGLRSRRQLSRIEPNGPFLRPPQSRRPPACGLRTRTDLATRRAGRPDRRRRRRRRRATGDRALEERGDAEIQIAEAGGDAIAAEFERYLRRRGRGPGPTGM